MWHNQTLIFLFLVIHDVMPGIVSLDFLYEALKMSN